MIRRSLKKILFSVAAAAMLLLVLTSNAKADTITGFQMKGLGNHLGQYLTVYYAMGSRASINTESDQVKIRTVKARKDFQITSDQITLPPVDIQRDGFFFPNIVVFVIHKTSDFRWVNIDANGNSAPAGEIATGSTAYESIDSLMLSELQLLKNSNQVYQFGQDK